MFIFKLSGSGASDIRAGGVTGNNGGMCVSSRLLFYVSGLGSRQFMSKVRKNGECGRK